MSLSPVISRLAAMALFAMALLFLAFISFVFFIKPISANITSLTDLKSRYVKLVNLHHKLNLSAETYEEFSKSASTRSELFQDDTPALASAQVQSRVQRYAKSAECDIQLFKVLPVKISDEVEHLNFKIELVCQKEGLREFVHRVETSAPYMLLKDVNLKQARIRGVETSSRFKLDASFIAFYEGKE